MPRACLPKVDFGLFCRSPFGSRFHSVEFMFHVRAFLFIRLQWTPIFTQLPCLMYIYIYMFMCVWACVCENNYMYAYVEEAASPWISHGCPGNLLARHIRLLWWWAHNPSRVKCKRGRSKHSPRVDDTWLPPSHPSPILIFLAPFLDIHFIHANVYLCGVRGVFYVHPLDPAAQRPSTPCLIASLNSVQDPFLLSFWNALKFTLFVAVDSTLTILISDTRLQIARTFLFFDILSFHIISLCLFEILRLFYCSPIPRSSMMFVFFQIVRGVSWLNAKFEKFGIFSNFYWN